MTRPISLTPADKKLTTSGAMLPDTAAMASLLFLACALHLSFKGDDGLDPNHPNQSKSIMDGQEAPQASAPHTKHVRRIPIPA
eukprot:1195846-Prorocentrum_minimum.AAC.11